MIASDVTDLPEPDSPTSPIVVPCGIFKLRFFTALTTFPSDMKVTLRFLISRRFSLEETVILFP